MAYFWYAKNSYGNYTYLPRTQRTGVLGTQENYGASHGTASRIVLESAVWKRTKEIAQMLEMRAATVSYWRNRFFRNRLDGLEDMPRPGKKAKYNREMERRILNVAEGSSWIS